MPFTLDEIPGSRSSTYAPPSQTRLYLADGEFDDTLVRAYALSGTPGTVFTTEGILYRQDIRIDAGEFAQYQVTVPYGRRKRETGSIAWNFDTTGGTVRIKCAREHIQTYPSDGDYHKGAIGVQPDGSVEGADIVIPALKLNVTYRHPLAIVGLDYARALHNFTGQTNSGEFLGFAAGELLFLGASGSDGSEAEADVTYQFGASPNVTGLTFGGISSIAKKGWEFAWTEFEDAVESGQPVRQAKHVHVERVYDSFDFGAVFGWS